MDGPTGRPADNPPSSDQFRVYHWTVPELRVQVYWQPRPPICQRFSLEPDPDPKWRSGTVGNTTNGEGGPHNHHFAPFFENNSAARWVKSGMRWNNPVLLCIIYRGQQANGISGAQTPIHASRSQHPLDDIHTPQADDIINQIGVESDDDAEMRQSNWKRFRQRQQAF